MTTYDELIELVSKNKLLKAPQYPTDITDAQIKAMEAAIKDLMAGSSSNLNQLLEQANLEQARAIYLITLKLARAEVSDQDITAYIDVIVYLNCYFGVKKDIENISVPRMYRDREYRVPDEKREVSFIQGNDAITEKYLEYICLKFKLPQALFDDRPVEGMGFICISLLTNDITTEQSDPLLCFDLKAANGVDGVVFQALAVVEGKALTILKQNSDAEDIPSGQKLLRLIPSLKMLNYLGKKFPGKVCLAPRFGRCSVKRAATMLYDESKVVLAIDCPLVKNRLVKVHNTIAGGHNIYMHDVVHYANYCRHTSEFRYQILPAAKVQVNLYHWMNELQQQEPETISVFFGAIYELITTAILYKATERCELKELLNSPLRFLPKEYNVTRYLNEDDFCGDRTVSPQVAKNILFATNMPTIEDIQKTEIYQKILSAVENRRTMVESISPELKTLCIMSIFAYREYTNCILEKAQTSSATKGVVQISGDTTSSSDHKNDDAMITPPAPQKQVGLR